jgi:ribose transport system substrate-binding protein
MIADVEEAFSKHPGGYRLINTTESKSEKIIATTQWENTLNTYPEINVAICFAAEAGPACAGVVREKNIHSKVIIYAVDDVDETLDLLRKGDIDGTIVTSFWNYGYQATYWLYQNITEGKKPAQVVNDAGTILVTKTNVDTYADALKIKKDL